jgi:hypothetical protein
MKAKFLIFISILLINPLYADDFDIALNNARQNCSGISDELNHMKTMAGINTAVTGVGTLAGGGAIATGLVKVGVDKKAEAAEIKLTRLREIEAGGNFTESVPDNFMNDFSTYFEQNRNTLAAEQKKLQDEKDDLTGKSKNLGNWRTGLMAGSTATNVAGAIIAGNNKVDKDLQTKINDCRSAVKILSNAKMQARMDGNTDTSKLSKADNIVYECGKFDFVDVSKINNRAKGAMISSIAGAAAGAAGTVTSVIANADKTRNDNNADGSDSAKEKNLNTASNVLAIGTTAASAAATIFNATQIGAIKRASEVADKCDGVLQ